MYNVQMNYVYIHMYIIRFKLRSLNYFLCVTYYTLYIMLYTPDSAFYIYVYIRPRIPFYIVIFCNILLRPLLWLVVALIVFPLFVL